MNNKINITLLISAFIIFAIGMVYGSYYIYQKNNNVEHLFSKYNKIITSELNEQIKFQTEMDSKIIDISSNGEYTFENPCVINNPYKISPLTSLIIFNTETPEMISVTINNTHTTVFEESTNHIIPIVGLNTNANNIIKLSMRDMTKELLIQTDSLYEYIDDLKIKDYLNGKKNLMLIKSSDAKPYIRGFDSNNNLIYYLKLGNITRANFYESTMQIVYNSEVINNDISCNIKIDMDYLGRIQSLNKYTNDVEDGSLITTLESDYLVTPIDLVPANSSNYDLVPISDTTSVTIPTIIKTSSMLSSLTKASDYKDDYSLSLNGNFINTNFSGQMVKLLLVSKSNQNTYAYDLNQESAIKIDLKGEYALFIIKDGNYYNLLNTLKL